MLSPVGGVKMSKRIVKYSKNDDNWYLSIFMLCHIMPNSDGYQLTNIGSNSNSA